MREKALPRFGRRALIGGGLGGLALSSLLLRSGHGATRAPGTDFAPKAKRAIWLFMAGGPTQFETFDYKPGLAKLYGQELPTSVRGTQRLTGMTSGQGSFPIAPSLFPFQQGGQSGAWVSDLLPWTRKMVDDLTIVKSLYTESVNHDPAMYNIHTGSQFPGKPSLGAWLSYGLGTMNENLPTYVVMTSAFKTRSFVQALMSSFWGSAFLPAQHAGVSVRSLGDPIIDIDDPPGVTSATRRTMLDAVHRMNDLAGAALGDPSVAERTAQYEQAFRMQSAVPGLMDISGESSSTLDLYGPDVTTAGTFAANCLRARRMLEQGVRFVQVYHRGWDAHVELPTSTPQQCADIDQACYGLVQDLKLRGLLDDTLVIWGGEFGRTVYCQGTLEKTNYGRDHHGRCFPMWFAGGGMKPGIVYGETDDFGYNIVSGDAHLRDMHATVLHQLGLDADALTFPYSGLNQRLVGVDATAQVIKGILA
ncbi:MAG TPA: DUF1501 domain-containing protein [Polyangiaceae bacterium]|nr:DUF1501 domain-containing protein [Polyangiaceae bacterium]